MLIEQGLRHSLSQKIDPKLIMANNVLQLSSMELQQVIEQELAENPALEVPEDDPCENCDQPKTLCLDCPFRKQAITADELDLSVYELEQPIDFAADFEDSEGDFIANIRAEITLQNHLVDLLHSVLSSEHWEVGEYIISNINDSGYLEGSVEEFGHELNVDIDEVESVLAVVQTFDPPGVGARDLRECLRIQLERLQEDDQGDPLALAIVKDFWTEMLGSKIGKIARRLKVTAKEVVTSINFVKRQLNPYPGNSFRPPYQTDEGNHGASVRPDVVVRKSEAGYEIDIAGHDQYFLNINSRYKKMYDDIRNGGAKKYTGDDKHRGLKTPPVFWPLLLHLCAGAYGAASRPKDGLLLLDEALAAEKFSSSSSESLTPEFLSLKGDLLLALSSDNAADAESLYQLAVNRAREVGAAMVELQGAMRLSRLWQDQGKSEQARELLSAAYSKITEGFATADMKEANALLSTLSS